ncbi:alpha/beta hydrolase [Rhodococcus sp. D2-41]|uniref:Alpha/beta hydrolase n=1 Tax=Speluncibacter jeojiensis TaxID=2710754 RepID=A0A9X4M533_9ACTN|nr:alpha/beta hydrolase [Rhodococcus sp. D2-41]MDG3009391.1 alpha/beta hydrolase [Rhodococcus sp. D2-41]MDG3016982.1 alpha/beta hydrolase [Corynebacteriales bacterium D3-21]
MVAPDPSTVRLPGPWRHLDVHANGIRVHAAEMGPADPHAPLTVLLHGYGDFWWTWRHQLPALAESGRRCVAIDLRGYGDTDKPPRGYDGWTLAGDVAGLIRALGHADAALIGHADGGLVCWATALLHPRQVSSIATVSAPHPLSLRRAVLRDGAQRRALGGPLLRDQLPWGPERRLVRDDGSAAEEMLRTRSGPAWVESAEFAEVAARARSAVQVPGAAHSALEYHRWAFRSQFRPDGKRFRTAMKPPLDVPVLQIYGEQDPYVLASTFRRCGRWAPLRRTLALPVGHYAHEESPQQVNAALLEFLRR